MNPTMSPQPAPSLRRSRQRVLQKARRKEKGVSTFKDNIEPGWDAPRFCILQNRLLLSHVFSLLPPEERDYDLVSL